MIIKFWGVRGSIPSPGPNTVKYGGNTSCVSILVKEPPVVLDTDEHPDEERLIILDGGSGLRELGIDMMKNIQFVEGILVPLEMWVFFSHTHWDHIQGLPFFEPLFIKGNCVHLYGEKKVSISLEETLKGQQQYPNFPISLDEITINGGKMDFTDLYAGQHIHVGNSVMVSTTKLSHPDGVFCYKVEESTEEGLKSVVYATDTEHRNVLDPRLLKIARGADILIYDAQYTPDEYVGNVGMPKFDWGHSTYEIGIDTALAANVKRLLLFHHDPKHTDQDIDKIVEDAETYAKKRKKEVSGLFKDVKLDIELTVGAAYESQEIELK